jgi:hypothetical protein
MALNCLLPNSLENMGSEQEFDGGRILSRSLDHHEFGPGGRHALRLEQQIPQILVAAAPA